ncbi:MAG: hypothetical protein D6800_02595 [Candidatus Zixiibacteriota bacterium]|nr:MAG: hypothetical protein D6800_02595 [candidate division Zixibacteria bacterium]
MRRIRLLTAITLVLGLCAVLPSAGWSAPKKEKPKKKKQICITFNELPAAQSFSGVDREAITYLILEALRKHHVKAAGFVVAGQIEDSWDILGEWLNAGHLLGSMTYSNQDFNELSIEQQIKEIERGQEAMEAMLKGFGQKRRYFRYPYLHYGLTIEARKQTTWYLRDHHITIVPATVVPEDYLYNLSLDKLGKRPDSASWVELRDEYLNHVFDELDRCEALAVELVHRPIRQILLLRANRLNAVFLDDMLTALEDAGYTFVSLPTALKDKVYSLPEAYYGPKGLGYLDMIKESDPDLLPAQ